METRRLKNVSVNKKKKKKTRENGKREDISFPMIPIDLIIEIFSRLPAKSIARFRCLSRPWDFILRHSYFTELFLTRSPSRLPQFLFACETDGELNFFTSPQLQNPDQDYSSSPPEVSASYHMKNYFVNHSSQISRCSVNGLVYHTTQRISNGNQETVPVIYNTTTGQSLVLPKVETSRIEVSTLLGYDPIDKQFKLMSMTYGGNKVLEEYQVLTLGTGNNSWRMIKCCRPHYASSIVGTCIDGVLYYVAAEDSSSRHSMVVCFDVRSEKFSFIEVPETFIKSWHGIPVKYNGKFGFLVTSFVERTTENIELCLLEEDGEWSKHTCVLPFTWRYIVGKKLLYIVGMTETNEIVMVTHDQDVPFYVFYYNIERKTTTRVRIRGMEAFENKRVQVFLNHIENLNLM